jgi:uncharacterized protein (DUF433 family)
MELPDFLESDADGEIRVAGHRIRLIDVAARYEEGYSAETICLDYYPSLDLAVVYKVIAFYLEHRDELSETLARMLEEVEQLGGQARSTPTLGELRRRMEKRRAEAT